MTREEAIRQLDGADIAVLNRDFFKFNQAIIMAISALRQQDVTDTDVGKNEPLTPDELRQMDNQPVWIEDVGEDKWHGSGWAIVDLEYCLVRKASNGNPAFFERYGKEWLAYRQKPEEDRNESV